MFKKNFNPTKSLTIILIANIIALIFISIFICFSTMINIIFILLTLSLTFFLLTFTTIEYQKYSKKNDNK